MVTQEELQRDIILKKADAFSYKIALEESEKGLTFAVGRYQGYQESKAEYEQKFGLPLSPEIEQKIQSIIRDVKAKAKKPKSKAKPDVRTDTRAKAEAEAPKS